MVSVKHLSSCLWQKKRNFSSRIGWLAGWLSIHWCIHQPISPPIHPPSLHPFIHPPIHLPIHPSIYLPIQLPLPIDEFIYPDIHEWTMALENKTKTITPPQNKKHEKQHKQNSFYIFEDRTIGKFNKKFNSRFSLKKLWWFGIVWGST